MESITFEKLSKSFVNAFLRFVLSFLYFLTWKHYYFDNYVGLCGKLFFLSSITSASLYITIVFDAISISMLLLKMNATSLSQLAHLCH